MTDESIMQFGAHKGKQLADVPAPYLIWLYEGNICFGELKEYIEDNLKVLKAERHEIKK